MSLFIGRVDRDVRNRDLEDLFSKFGALKRCEIKQNFAFVTFDDERDAEDALEKLNGTDFFGQRINIEWAKSSGRRESNSVRDDRCFTCGERGHFARNCRSGGGRRGGRDSRRSPPRRRSYSPRRRSRSRSRSPSRRSRSRSPRRDRDRSRSPRKSSPPPSGRSNSPISKESPRRNDKASPIPSDKD